jgi:hypothetical protein
VPLYDGRVSIATFEVTRTPNLTSPIQSLDAVKLRARFIAPTPHTLHMTVGTIDKNTLFLVFEGSRIQVFYWEPLENQRDST